MKLSNQLVYALTEDPSGICGTHDPAESLQDIADIETRLRCITFGVILTVLPSPERWAGLTRLAAINHWLVDPSQVAYKTSQQVLVGMQAEQLGTPRHNARVWWQISRGLQGRFHGSVRELLRSNEDSSEVIRSYVIGSKTTFPVLAGPVTSVRWLDLIHRIGNVALDGWESLQVLLPPGLWPAAETFGIKTQMTHPQLRLALEHWQSACKGWKSEQCGLTLCPLRREPGEN